MIIHVCVATKVLASVIIKNEQSNYFIKINMLGILLFVQILEYLIMIIY